MADTIVYMVYSNPGGIDGMDTSDKGGQLLQAHLAKYEAEKAKNGWNTVRPEVHDLEEVYKQVLSKLSPLEKLALERANNLKGMRGL